MPPFDPEHDRIRRPTLANSCAQAATAEEARYRLVYPRATQASRVIALDESAAPVVCGLAQNGWSDDARFLVYETLVGVADANGDGPPADARLRSCDGQASLLTEELADAELVVMVAATDEGAEAASLIGDVCAQRRIMTTGLVLAEWDALPATLSSLRPNSMVMLVSPDADDLVGILTALRV